MSQIMIQEHDIVELTEDLNNTSFIKGDIGTVVHTFPSRGVYLVEFNLNGIVTGIEIVKSHQIKTLNRP